MKTFHLINSIIITKDILFNYLDSLITFIYIYHFLASLSTFTLHGNTGSLIYNEIGFLHKWDCLVNVLQKIIKLKLFQFWSTITPILRFSKFDVQSSGGPWDLFRDFLKSKLVCFFCRWCETSSVWACIKALTSNCICSHCILLCHVSFIHALKNILQEVLGIIDFVKPQSLATCLLNILCDEMRSMHRHLYCIPKYDSCLKEKHLYGYLSWKLNQLLFSWNTTFTGKNGSKSSYGYWNLSNRQTFSWK